MRSIWKLSTAGAAALALVTASAAAATASTDSTPGVQHACSASVGPNYAQCLVLVRTGVATHKGVAHNVTPLGYGPSSAAARLQPDAGRSRVGKDQTVAIVDAFNDPTAEADLRESTVPSTACRRVPPPTGASARSPGRAGQPAAGGRRPAGPPRSHSTSTWSPRSARTATSCWSRRTTTLLLTTWARGWILPSLSARSSSATRYAGPEVKGYGATYAYYDHPALAVPVASRLQPGTVQISPTASAVCDGGRRNDELTVHKAAARGWAEQVWGNGTSGTDGDGTGSGCSAYEAKPSWQTLHRGVRTARSPTWPPTPTRTPAPRSSTATTSSGAWLEVPAAPPEATPIIAATYALAGHPRRWRQPGRIPVRAHWSALRRCRRQQRLMQPGIPVQRRPWL